MDETYKNGGGQGIDVRVVGDQDSKPQTLVITNRNGSSIDRDNVQDITKGTAHAMQAPNGQVTVFAQQSNGTFNQHQMEIHRPHRNPEARQIGEATNVSAQQVNENISKTKEQSKEMSFENQSQYRQEYLNEQKNKR